MQLFPQSLPLVQFGTFRPPLAIEVVVGAMRVAGAGDCIGVAGVVAAGFGFIIPANIEGFFAGAAAVAGAGFAAVIAAGAGVAPADLHDIRLCVVGSWQ
jgi:hypothetical protein